MGLWFSPIYHDNFHHWVWSILMNVFLFMWPVHFYFSAFITLCVSLNHWCAFIKCYLSAHMEKESLVPDWVMKMHSPIKQKHTPWNILSNIMNYPTTVGTEGFSCVVISCSVLVTQAAIMYHVESEYEFQSHDYLLLLLPLTSSPTPTVIYCLSYWS